MRNTMKLAVLTALAGGAFLAGAPAASAECTDLNGQGTLCTTGDPATGSFGVGLHAGSLNVCVNVFTRCP